MEHEIDSHQRSPNIAPVRWRGSTNVLQEIQNIGLTSLTPTLQEHLLLKSAIKHWQTPVHIEYRTLAARLASFKDWPHTMTQTPESLSEAGFFYTGKINFE